MSDNKKSQYDKVFSGFIKKIDKKFANLHKYEYKMLKNDTIDLKNCFQKAINSNKNSQIPEFEKCLSGGYKETRKYFKNIFTGWIPILDRFNKCKRNCERNDKNCQTKCFREFYARSVYKFDYARKNIN